MGFAERVASWCRAKPESGMAQLVERGLRQFATGKMYLATAFSGTGTVEAVASLVLFGIHFCAFRK